MLTHSGWLSAEIEEAFSEVKGKTVSLAVKEPEKAAEKPKEKKNVFGFLKKKKAKEEMPHEEEPQKPKGLEMPQVPKEKAKEEMFSHKQKEEPKDDDAKDKEVPKDASKPLKQKPMLKEGGKGGGFILTIISGVLVIFNGVYTAFLKDMMGDFLGDLGMTAEIVPLAGMEMMFGVLGIAVGALMIIFYLVLRRVRKTAVAGILILALALVSLAMGGFFAGAGIGIIAGILVILKK